MRRALVTTRGAGGLARTPAPCLPTLSFAAARPAALAAACDAAPRRATDCGLSAWPAAPARALHVSPHAAARPPRNSSTSMPFGAAPASKAPAPASGRTYPFRELWRKFNLKVHPDLFTRFPDLQANNQEALSKLQGLLDEMKTRERTEADAEVAKEKRVFALAFFLRTDQENHFAKVPFAVEIPKGAINCRNVMTEAMGRLFTLAGLPSRFDWGPDYWGSTYAVRQRIKAEDGTTYVDEEGEEFDEEEMLRREEAYRRNKAAYNANRRGGGL